jgi:hypothetical protein
MTREEFIKFLNGIRQRYKIEEDNLIIFDSGTKVNNISLGIVSLPENVVFENSGSVSLDYLDFLPPNTTFSNKGAVSLSGLKKISKGVKFINEGSVELWSLKTIPVDFKFYNKGLVYTKNFHAFKFNGLIDGIEFIPLFNLMIKQGLFQ